jgi:flagellar biosynthesis protein FlhG
VAGGKGGIGKSNLALNLSVQVSRRGQRVILVDADTQLANAGILAQIATTPPVTTHHYTAPLSAGLREGPEGVRMLCSTASTAPARAAWPRTGEDWLASLAALRGEAAFVVVDCGSGITPTLAALTQASDLLLLVTTPEPTSVVDCYATLKYVVQRGYRGRTGVLVNMARRKGEGPAIVRRLARVAYPFLGLSVEDLGAIPFDPRVADAVRARVPVTIRYPRCAASLALDAVAGELDPAADPGPPGAGVWTRLAGLFL